MKMKVKNLLVSTLIAVVFAVSLSTLVSAQTTVIVTPPVNSQGWSTADTRPGGSVSFVLDNTAPGGGGGALRLTTNATTTAKAQYLHAANTDLADIDELSYYTRQISASFAGGNASYQLPVCLGGFNSPQTTTNPTGCTGFTTLVYEPYQNGTVIPNVWQFWDVDAGQFWSSRTYSDGTCSVSAGGGGAPFYTLAGLQTLCPNAVAVGFGVNIGSNNPSYNVYTDLVNFNGTTYNFDVVPSNSSQCKNGGWANLMRADGTTFKNQGDCIQYVNTGK
jgi:hypothetical protein